MEGFYSRVPMWVVGSVFVRVGLRSEDSLTICE